MGRTSITIVAGGSGSGNSTFALRYLVNAPLVQRFIFDPDGEASERLGIPSARSAHDLFLWFNRGWAVFDPGEFCPGEAAAGFDFFCDWCVEMSSGTVGRKCLLVDEAWKYVNVRKHPVELEQAVRGGRHVELNCLFTTQTPGQLHETIRNDCTELVCFALRDEKSLEFPRSRGLDGAEIAALPDLAYVAKNLRSREELRGRLVV